MRSFHVLGEQTGEVSASPIRNLCTTCQENLSETGQNNRRCELVGGNEIPPHANTEQSK